MIKKSVFEDELIAGMQRELTSSFEKTAAVNNLVKAADLLNAAVEIYEEAGMTAKADQVLRILGKIAIAAHDTKVREMPSLKALMDAGVTHQDLKNTHDPFSRARVNTALRVLGYTEKEIKHYLGEKYMSEDEAADLLNPERPYQKIQDWITNPATPVDPKNPQVGEEISMKSLPITGPGDTLNFKSLVENSPSKPGKDDLVFKSIANDENDARKPNKPKNPTKVNNSYNIPPLEMALADDFLDLDINDAEAELLEESPEDKTFEDSD